MPKPLSQFTLFPSLPIELRNHIWLLATHPGRFLHVEEVIDEHEIDSDGISPELLDVEGDEDLRGYYLETDPNYGAIETLDIAIQISHDFFSNDNQSQLESFGFTSSRARPGLPNNFQLRKLRDDWIESKTNRYFETTQRDPVLLQVCRESRLLLKSHGYSLGFGSRSSPARTWFNFEHDFLYLGFCPHENEVVYGDHEEWGWKLSKFKREDLQRVKKLALQFNCSFIYEYGGPLPKKLLEAIEYCPSLNELAIVEKDCLWESRSECGYPNDYADVVEAIDISVEEMYGYGAIEGSFQAEILEGFRRVASSITPNSSMVSSIKTDVEERLFRHHSTLRDSETSIKSKWKPPKVRIVTLIPGECAPSYIERRQQYSLYIDKLYQQRISRRLSRNDELEMALGGDEQAYLDQVREQYQYGELEAELGRLTEARDILLPVPEKCHSPCTRTEARDILPPVPEEGYSPYTKQWLEAQEAMEDMDRW